MIFNEIYFIAFNKSHCFLLILWYLTPNPKETPRWSANHFDFVLRPPPPPPFNFLRASTFGKSSTDMGPTAAGAAAAGGSLINENSYSGAAAAGAGSGSRRSAAGAGSSAAAAGAGSGSRRSFLSR